MISPIHILLVDDQRLMREGLRTLLELEEDLLVVGEAGDGQAAITLFEQLRPDVVLMDIRMPVMDGVEATRRLCATWPQAHILILTTFDDDASLFPALQAGALGYLLKDSSGNELAAAVRTIASGAALIGPALARKVLGQFGRLTPPITPPPMVEPLSDRELDILRLLAEGYSNGQIAGRLNLAEGTVKNYVTNILQKTGSRDRTQAALRAKALGLL